MTRHSETLRLKLVTAYAACKSYTAVAREQGVSAGTVKLWVMRAKHGELLSSRPRSGRPRVLSTPAANLAVEALLEQGLTAKQAAQQLHTKGHVTRVVHRSTLIRAAREEAASQGIHLAVHTGKPAKQLTANTKRKRLAFALANRDRNWQRVMFTDRKRFQFWYPGTKVQRCRWIKKGAKPEAYTANKPQCVNLYAGITKAGITACQLVAGTSKHTSTFKTKMGKPARNITCAEYENVLQSLLLPSGDRLLRGSSRQPWVLQQDNDPSHKVAPAVIATWNRNYGRNCQLLGNWPPNSPDLNPIENVWSWVDGKVQQLGCKTFDEFKTAVRDTLQSVPSTHLAALFDSMPRRILKVIERQGDKTGF